MSPSCTCPGSAGYPVPTWLGHTRGEGAQHSRALTLRVQRAWRQASRSVFSPPGGVARDGLLPWAQWRGCRAGRGRRPAHPHGPACSGLCGNFNGDTTDDFTTSMGIAEGTATLFVDSWRAGNCPAALERETDPCSMSQLNSECRAAEGCGGRGDPAARAGHPPGPVPAEACAETHCSVLVKTGTVFEKCHALVNPKPFYKVGRACRRGGLRAWGARGTPGCGRAGTHVLSARRGVCTRPATTKRPSRTSAPPWGTTRTPAPRAASCSAAGETAWTTAVRAGRAGRGQEGVSGARRGSGPEAMPGPLPKGLTSASPTAVPCTGNQTFSYDSRACGRTCLSLSDRTAECHPSAVPVDGCNCPEGTYLNHEAKCVRKARCPCLLANHKFIPANQSTVVDGIVWCVRGPGRVTPPRPAAPAQADPFIPHPLQPLHQRAAELPGAATDARGYVASQAAGLALPHHGPEPVSPWAPPPCSSLLGPQDTPVLQPGLRGRVWGSLCPHVPDASHRRTMRKAGASQGQGAPQKTVPTRQPVVTSLQWPAPEPSTGP